jgi:hypothetical protein
MDPGFFSFYLTIIMCKAKKHIHGKSYDNNRVGGDITVVGVLNRNTVSTKLRYGTYLPRWGFLDESPVVGGNIQVVGEPVSNKILYVQSIGIAPTFPGGDFLMKAL